MRHCVFILNNAHAPTDEYFNNSFGIRAITGQCATCTQSLMSLTACEEYKPLGTCLNFSMSALPKTSQRTAATKQQWPESQHPILQYSVS